MDAKKLLDALVGASAAPPATGSNQLPRQPLQDMLGVFGGGSGGIGDQLARALQDAVGNLRDVGRDTNVLPRSRQEGDQGAGDGEAAFETVAEKVRALLGGLPKGGLIALGGLLLGTRGGRALGGQLARLGGLALIGGLVYRAYKRSQDNGSAPHRLDPSQSSEADALLFIRAMVAAMSADGHIDEAERARIVTALRRAGIGTEEANWLEHEIAKPAGLKDLTNQATSPEKAAQVYAAARLAIEPDTPQEREFLSGLAENLKLDPVIKREIDDGATGLKLA